MCGKLTVVASVNGAFGFPYRNLRSVFEVNHKGKMVGTKSRPQTPISNG